MVGWSKIILPDIMDCSLPGSRPWSSPGKNTGVSCHFLLQFIKEIFGKTKYLGKTKAIHVYCNPCAQLCPTLWDPTDCSPPGSSAHGIFPARTLEWVAIPSSRGSSWPLEMEPMYHLHCRGIFFFKCWATWKSTVIHRARKNFTKRYADKQQTK